MKRKLLVPLVILGAVGAAGAAVWSQRFELALDRVRDHGDDRGMLTSAAWSVLGDFDDRSGLEAFVREQLVESSSTAAGHVQRLTYESTPLLSLSSRVYARQPERVDTKVIAASLVLESLERAGYQHHQALPGIDGRYWTALPRGSDTFRTGMRLAAIQLAKLRFPSSQSYPVSAYVALARALADSAAGPDPELASSVAAFILAADPHEGEADSLAAAVARIAGPGGAAAVWTAALTETPGVDPKIWVWDSAVEALASAPAPRDRPAAEAVLSYCLRRSAPPDRYVDEGCVDLGLAWGAAWVARLRAAALRDGSDAVAARALLAAHERWSGRSWQSVIAAWREAEPYRPTTTPVSTASVAAMKPMARRSRLPRSSQREAGLLMAAGAAALPAVEAQYRANRNLDVVATAAFVLSRRAPQRLASATTDRIERFRPLALSFARGTSGYAEYSVERERVELGLLALVEHAEGPPRTYPLILALSIPEQGFTEYASEVLRSTLAADEFTDALFGFLAVRESYLVTEVEVYQNTLTSYGDVGPAIERNLTRLLAAAHDRPEDVPWILKVIGISALGEVGGPSARSVLGRYAPDTSSYLRITAPENNPEAPTGSEERRFDALVESALAQIASREGS